ncbi:MAG TPA: BMP family ABC transporter substrate-binding protein [Acidimicrobiales bacterium]|nr:BMP family ABC transporter substrate-binding protein [Acidimicrobiales bacterium]
MKQRSSSKLLILLFAVFALAVASCASSDSDGGSDGGGSETAATCQGTPGEKQEAADLGGSDDPDGSGKKVGLVFDIGGKDDNSFNESAYNGLLAAKDNMGVEIKALEPNTDGSNREDLLRQLAEDGYGLIIGVGFNFADPLTTVAKDYPDTDFGIVDSVVEEDNVASITFAEEQGSFLVGAIAAQSTQTGTVGFVGGVEQDLIKKFEAGFTAGVKEVKSDADVEVKYISPDGDFSGFNDPAKGKTIASGLYDAGADVVFHASGGSGSGVFKAAVDADRLAIGVDSDQYFQVDEPEQKCMLSSMLKRVDVGVYDTIADYAGNGFKSGVQVFDLANGGIDYSQAGGQVKDPAQIDDLKQQIIDGDIEVPTKP